MITKICSKCKIDKPISEYGIHNQYADGKRPECKACRKLVTQRYYQNNKKNIDSRNREWRSRNRAVVNAAASKRRSAKLQATPLWSDEEVIKSFYQEAEYFNEHIDHIIPLQHDLVCGLHCEDNLQLLPQKENLKKYNTFSPSTYTQ